MIRFYILLVAIAILAVICLIIHWIAGAVVCAGAVVVNIIVVKFHKQLTGIDLTDTKKRKEP